MSIVKDSSIYHAKHKGVVISGFDNVTFSNNIVLETKHNAIDIEGSNNLIIQNNVFAYSKADGTFMLNSAFVAFDVGARVISGNRLYGYEHTGYMTTGMGCDDQNED